MPSALITGASSGIGNAIARDLLEDGWNVTAVSRRPERGRLDGAHLVAANVALEEECVAAVAAHRERHGRLDLLVNNAGIGIAGATESYPTSKWQLQFDVNVNGVFVITRESLSMLREARGLVVNISSVAGLQGAANMAAYSASKHAVIGFTRSLNQELAGEGVRATAICPAFVATPMTEWVQGSVPPELMIQPADIARCVRFLLELSPACVVPELPVRRVGGDLG